MSLTLSFLQAWLDRQTESLIASPACLSDPAPLPDDHGYRSQGSQGTHGVCGLYDTDAERGATEYRGLRSTEAPPKCGGDRHGLLKLGVGNLPDQPDAASARPPKGKGKGKRKGGGKNKGRQLQSQQGDWTGSSSEWGHGWQQGSRQIQGDLLHQLSRHELQNVQSHTKIHLYLRTGAHSFLPSLFSIAREWGPSVPGRAAEAEPLPARDSPGCPVEGDGHTCQAGDEQGDGQAECGGHGLADHGGQMGVHAVEPADGSALPGDHEEILRDIDKMGTP